VGGILELLLLISIKGRIIDKIGSKIGKVKVFSIDDLPQLITEVEPRIGIIAVPEDAAQQITDLLVDNGIQILLNFASVCLEVPSEVYLQNVDLTIELQNLLYYSQSLKI
jgi:redox-sensing transcriptional repressor